MLPRTTLLKLAGVIPAAILATGLFFAIRPAMNGNPVFDEPEKLAAPDVDFELFEREELAQPEPGDVFEEPLTFAEGRPLWPSPGQTVTFEYASHGCFHSVSSQLVVRGGSLDPDAEELSDDPDGPRTAAMTPGIRADIEKTIGYLRSEPRGGCTTTDTVTITWKTGDTVDAPERLVDGSCQLPHSSGVKSLGSIIDELPATRLNYQYLNP